MKLYANVYERIVANTIVPEDQNSNGCWEWQGSTSCGYGKLGRRVPGGGRATPPKTIQVHRAMEQHLRDQAAQMEADMALPGLFELAPDTPAPPLTSDETIDHLCWVRRCANPGHWHVKSRSENSKEMQRRRKILQTGVAP